MNYDVITSESFVRQLKKLSKKYGSLKQEVGELGNILSENPTLGTPIGKDCYKIRLVIKSKGKGKSGGARVISLVVAVQESVILLSIYDKSQQENIDEKELERLLKEVL